MKISNVNLDCYKQLLNQLDKLKKELETTNDILLLKSIQTKLSKIKVEINNADFADELKVVLYDYAGDLLVKTNRKLQIKDIGERE